MNVQENVHVAKGLGGWFISFWYTLFVLVGCLISMTLVLIAGGSLAAQWRGAPSLALMLTFGLALCLLPTIILNGFITWLRQQWNQDARFFETFFSIFLLGNLALLLSLVVWMPDQTSRALYRHGNWLFDRDVAQMLQISEQHPVLQTGRKLVRRMAYLLEFNQADHLKANNKTDHKPPTDTASSQTPSSPLHPLGPLPRPSDPTPSSTSSTQAPQIPKTFAPLNPNLPNTGRAKPPISPHTASQDYSLQVRRHGNSLVVPLGLPGLRRDFLLDTGASFLSLSTAMAQQLRVTPSADSPTLTLHTANGVIKARVGLLPTLEIGKYKLRHVAFVLCDACGEPQQDVVGLLGLNVLRRFLVTIDQASGTIYLRPQDPKRFRNQAADLRPFLLWPNDKLRGYTTNMLVRRVFQLSGTLQNKAPLDATDLRFRISYLRNKNIIGQYEFAVGKLEAHEQMRVSIRDNRAPQFESYRVELIDGRWE